MHRYAKLWHINTWFSKCTFQILLFCNWLFFSWMNIESFLTTEVFLQPKTSILLSTNDSSPSISVLSILYWDVKIAQMYILFPRHSLSSSSPSPFLFPSCTIFEIQVSFILFSITSIIVSFTSIILLLLVFFYFFLYVCRLLIHLVTYFPAFI